MRRALGAVAAVAILAGGCASRGSVSRLQADLATLRAEVTELRGLEDRAGADRAATRAAVQRLETQTAEVQARVQAIRDELTRLVARAEAAERDIRRTRDELAALPRAAAPPPPPPAPPPAPPRTARLVPPRELAGPRPQSPEQTYAAALATFRAREHGQAVLDFLDFIAKHPKHALTANAQYWIGEAYYAQRDWRQALLEFQKVLEIGRGKVPDALVKIGLCYAQLRDGRRARQTWERVGREFAGSDAAATARVLLRAHAGGR
jgi:tol-pal system protein YbgF